MGSKMNTPSAKSPLKLFVFGDQAYTVPKRELRRLMEDYFQQSVSDSPSPISQFIERCEEVLQVEMEQMDTSKAGHFWPSSSLLDLFGQWRFRDASAVQNEHHDMRRCLPLDMALLCAYQIMLFMRHVEFHALGTYDNAVVIGSCTGALAAAAVGCSATLEELVPSAVEAVRVAFRVGLVVEKAALACEPAIGTEQPWSMVVSAADKRKLQGVAAFLERFVGEGKDSALLHNNTSGVNGVNKPEKGPCWVSAWTPSSITVSGPPPALAELATSDGFTVPGIRMAPMPIFAPFHTPLLFPEDDVTELLAAVSTELAKRPAKMTVLSAATGKPTEEVGDLGYLMRNAAEDILLRPLRWDLVLQQLCEQTETDDDSMALLDVIPIASSAEQSIYAALNRTAKIARKRGMWKRRGLGSTTIHRVVNETDLMVGDGLYMVTEADLSRSDLHEAVRGHLVEGKQLCTPSVYADIAMTLGNYLVKKLREHDKKLPLGALGKSDRTLHKSDFLVSIANLSVSKALVAGDYGQGTQMLQCHAQADWSTHSARCKFVVSNSPGKPEQHAECTINLGDATSLRDLLTQHSSAERHQLNVRSLCTREGTTHLTGNTAYKLVSSLADFHRNHRLVRSLVLDSRTHECAARVGFPSDLAHHGEYTAHPAAIDAFTQPAGFCLNLDDATDLEKIVYVNHGWDEMYLFEEIDMSREYTVYVQMKQVGRSRKWAGDIVVLLDAVVAAVFLQYTVSAFPRRVFSNLLSQETRRVEATMSPPRTPQTAVPMSPLWTPRPGMSLSIETKGPERAGNTLFPPSPVSPDDLSRTMTSTSSGPSTSWTNGRGSGSTADQSGGTSPATSSNGRLTPRGFFTPASTSSEVESGGEEPQNQPVKHATEPGQILIPISACKSVVLQGTPKTATKILFLFPDGSGSAASYASLPSVGQDACVVGLVCPFLKGDTAAMARVPLDRLLLEGYLPEILRRQPPSSSSSSPYILGGWSAGGSLAFRAAQLLIGRGCRVGGLVLIDAPTPLNGLDRLPKHFYEYCERLGIFRGWDGKKKGEEKGKAPDWLIPHFEGTISVLEKYCATPLELRPGEKMRVDLIWAGESVVDRPSAPPLPPHSDDTEGMKFLTKQRTDFGPNEWAHLLPGSEVSCHRVEGAHHFSLMREPFVSQLSQFVAEGLEAVKTEQCAQDGVLEKPSCDVSQA